MEQLLEFYQEQPDDPFNIYALALEYLKTDEGKARHFFELLLSRHEDYIPTYYHAAKLYADLGDRERAIATFEKGISQATKFNDSKAARELKSAYDEFLF